MAKKVSKTTKKVASSNGFNISTMPLDDSPTEALFKHIAWSLGKSTPRPGWKLNLIEYDGGSFLCFYVLGKGCRWVNGLLEIDDLQLILRHKNSTKMYYQVVPLSSPDCFKLLSEMVAKHFHLDCDFTPDPKMPHIKIPYGACTIWRNEKVAK